MFTVSRWRTWALLRRQRTKTTVVILQLEWLPRKTTRLARIWRLHFKKSPPNYCNNSETQRWRRRAKSSRRRVRKRSERRPERQRRRRRLSPITIRETLRNRRASTENRKNHSQKWTKRRRDSEILAIVWRVMWPENHDSTMISRTRIRKRRITACRDLMTQISWKVQPKPKEVSIRRRNRNQDHDLQTARCRESWDRKANTKFNSKT